MEAENVFQAVLVGDLPSGDPKTTMSWGCTQKASRE